MNFGATNRAGDAVLRRQCRSARHHSAVDTGQGQVRLLNTPNDQSAGCTFRKDDRRERYVDASFAIRAQAPPSPCHRHRVDRSAEP